MVTEQLSLYFAGQ